MPEITTIDEYIASLNSEAQQRLKLVRQTVKDVAPDAIEDISYGVAAWRLKEGKRGFAFAGGYGEHVSLYPVPTVDDPQLQLEITKYQAGKGTLKFMNNQQFPETIVRQVVQALYGQAKRKDK